MPAEALEGAEIIDGEGNVSHAERLEQWRDVGVGAQIIKELGITSIRLLAKQERSYVGLAGFGIKLAGTEILD